MDSSTDGGKIDFQLVHNSRSAANPSGDAKLAWDRHESKYRPSTAPRYMGLGKILVNNKLAPNTNSDELSSQVTQCATELDHGSLSVVGFYFCYKLR